MTFRPKYARKSNMSELTPRQERFAQEYVLDLNAMQAAVRAGYSKKGAKTEGTRQLANAGVAARIAQLLAERKIATLRTVEATHDEIRALAHSDIRAVFDELGRIKPAHEWPDEVARCVASLEVTERYEDGADPEGEPTLVRITKLKLWDKPAALNMKGRTQKLFTDTLEVKLDQSTAERLAAARARAKEASDVPTEEQ